MTGVHTIRLLRYWKACAVGRLLIGLPGESAVLTRTVAEKGDDACRADKDVDASATGEQQRYAGRAVLSHLVWLSF